MNQSLISLQNIAKKPSRTIIGLMSGTSLDGLDIALCSVTGSGFQTDVDLREFRTVDYSPDQKERLKKITSVDSVSLADLCYMHTRLAIDHAEMINDSLKSWGIYHDKVDCIASHGQTIYHLPARDQKENQDKINCTLQIGDGDHIAAHTGIITISDFRQKHIALGGEGAPLASLVDRLLFSDSSESRIMLNIGGIANFTLLPPINAENATNAKYVIPYTTDTGPGNTLIDNVVQAYFNRPFDENGEIAKKGSVNNELLVELLDDIWFDGKASKSTGPEYFNLDWIFEKTDDIGSESGLISPEDLVATVTELSARTISDSIKACAVNLSDTAIYVSGGGARNPVLINRIKKHLGDCQIRNVSELGIDADAKEAVIFAVLANEMLAGNGFEFQTESGIKVGNLGKISFPV